MEKYGYSGSQQFRPLSPWAYFGYMILFSIPLVGLIALIVLSFNSENINRRSFARSYWCVYLIALVVFIIVSVGGGLAILSRYRY